MKNAILYLSWFTAFFAAAIYSKVFEIPLWTHIALQAVTIVMFFFGLYGNAKNDRDK